jgi:uncharacterized membrane-anchored protein YjiN (DUF445 family)
MSPEPDRIPDLIEPPPRRRENRIHRGLFDLIDEKLRGRPLGSTPKLAPPRSDGSSQQPRRSMRIRWLLPVLRALPWLLAATFVASLIWDFEGMWVVIAGRRITLEGLLRTISIGGLIGFLTNWLAIQMLFHPREPRPLLGHGLVPAQRERIIERLARTISEELINKDVLKQRIEESGVISHYRDASTDLVRDLIEDPEFRAELKQIATRHVEGVLDDPAVRERIVNVIADRIQSRAGRGVAGWLVRIYRTLDEETYRTQIERAVREIPSALDPVLDHLDERLDRLPDGIERHAGRIEDLATRAVLGFVEQLDVHGMLVENMDSYDESKLERMLKTAADEQLRFIKYIGAVLGCIGGLVIWKPGLALAVLALLGGLVFVADTVWHRTRRRARFSRS